MDLLSLHSLCWLLTWHPPLAFTPFTVGHDALTVECTKYKKAYSSSLILLGVAMCVLPPQKARQSHSSMVALVLGMGCAWPG